MQPLNLEIKVPDGDYCSNEKDGLCSYCALGCRLLDKPLESEGPSYRKICKHLFKKEIKEYDTTWEQRVKKRTK
jgi:hypothetical protein